MLINEMKNFEGYKIAVVGPKEVTQGFEALGFEAVSVLDEKELVKKLYEIRNEVVVKDGEEVSAYAVAFVLEDLMREVSKEDYAKLTARALPAIIALPRGVGESSFGQERLKQLVERAVGQDILGD